MTAVSAAKAILEGDATLVTAATGGIYDYAELGRLGLSRTTVAGAFDSNGIIKPCVVVRSSSNEPDGILNDDANQLKSLREVLSIWFYEDVGFANIETMRDRVYVLLHAVQLDATFICYWDGDLRQLRDDDLDASVERSRYIVHRKRSV